MTLVWKKDKPFSSMALIMSLQAACWATEPFGVTSTAKNGIPE